MANPLRISARVEIDAKPAQQGAAAATKAVDTVGDAAQETAAQLAKLQQAANNGLRTPLGGNNTGVELDKLRAKFNPLYAAIAQYKQTQMEIRQAHAAGSLSTDEMTAALDRNRRATMASIDALKGRNSVIAATPVAANVNKGVRGFETANIAAQLQDIGVTTAMGMSPLQIALQQGTQLSAIIGGMQNPIRGLASAFMSVVSPVSLLTIGIITAGTSAIQYFMGLSSEGSKANEALEKQHELIVAVTKQWGDAVPALQAYIAELEKRKETESLISATNIVADEKWELAREQVKKTNTEFADLLSTLQMAGVSDNFLSKLQASWNGVSEGIRKGKSDTEAMKSVQDNLASAMQTTGITAVDRFSKSFEDLALTIAGASRQAGIFQQQTMQALTVGTNPLKPLSSLFSDNGKIYTPEQFLPKDAPTPQKRPLFELEYMPGEEAALRKSGRSATSAAHAYRDLLKSADDRIAQMKLEAQLAGQTGVASDALRFKLDLLQQSEEKGRHLSGKQIEAINSRVDAFRKYAEAASSAKLKADLLFEREQMGRSAMDQQIAGSLRSSGLPVDFNSYEAGLIRTNVQLQYARDLAGDFTSTFFAGLRQGESVWDAFGNAGVKALERISDTLMNDVLNSIFSVSGATSGGGGLFSGLFSGLFGGGSFPSAPGGLHAKGGTFLGGISGYSNQIVNRPTMFAFAKGTGLMGEAGPEAIMPLTRDASGRLGVSADVSPLMSQATVSAMGAQPAQSQGTLRLKLGVEIDEEGNIKPFVKKVVQEDAPEITVDIINDYRGKGLRDDIADYNMDPRWRG